MTVALLTDFTSALHNAIDDLLEVLKVGHIAIVLAGRVAGTALHLSLVDLLGHAWTITRHHRAHSYVTFLRGSDRGTTVRLICCCCIYVFSHSMARVLNNGVI